MSDYTYDIICLVDTWLKKEILDSEVLNNSAYIVERRDRCTTESDKCVGGVFLIAVSTNLFPGEDMTLKRVKK